MGNSWKPRSHKLEREPKMWLLKTHSHTSEQRATRTTYLWYLVSSIPLRSQDPLTVFLHQGNMKPLHSSQNQEMFTLSRPKHEKNKRGDRVSFGLHHNCYTWQKQKTREREEKLRAINNARHSGTAVSYIVPGTRYQVLDYRIISYITPV